MNPIEEMMEKFGADKTNYMFLNKCFELCLIKDLINSGLTYNPKIKETDKYSKEYFGITIPIGIQSLEEEIILSSERAKKAIIKILRNKDINFNDYEFSIIKVERLRETHGFSDLIRGLFVYKKKQIKEILENEG